MLIVPALFGGDITSISLLELDFISTAS